MASKSRFIRENFDTLEPAPLKRGFRFEDDDKWLVIEWGGYDYEVEMSRITTPLQLLGWVSHLGNKSWTDCTAERLARLVEVVAKKRGWNIYGL